MSIILKAKYKKGFFAKKVSIESFMDNVADINVENNYNATLTRFGDNDFTMELIPSGIISFHVTENNLAIEAPTSFLGAGFHKGVIDVLEALEHKMSLHFDYDDPTDYQATKAFPFLQKEMLKDLKALLVDVRTSRETTPTDASHYLGWTNPWYPTNQNEIVTSFGSYTLENLQVILDEDKLELFAMNYFIWYNEDKDALYHRQLALYSLWNEYKWRKPIHSTEAKVASEIVHNLEIARMLDNDITLPHKAWQQICSLNGLPYLNMNESAALPDDHIGYLRNKVHFLLPLDYGIKLIGTFTRKVEDGAIVLTDRDRFIRIQPVRENRAGMIMNPSRMLQHVDFKEEIDGYLYVGEFSETNVQDSGTTYTLSAFVQGHSTFANVLIMYRKEEDKEWAVGVLKSIETPFDNPITFAMLE